MLELSIIVNVALAISLLVIVTRSKKAIKEEKLATFAGCLKSLSRSLLCEKGPERFKLAAFELASIMGGDEKLQDDVYFYLARASYIRPFRSACLADVGGEYLRLLAIHTAGNDDEDGNQIMEYIGNPEKNSDGVVIELRDYFGEVRLVAAQLVAEGKLLNLYRRDVENRQIKIFAKSAL